MKIIFGLSLTRLILEECVYFILCYVMSMPHFKNKSQQEIWCNAQKYLTGTQNKWSDPQHPSTLLPVVASHVRAEFNVLVCATWWVCCLLDFVLSQVLFCADSQITVRMIVPPNPRFINGQPFWWFWTLAWNSPSDGFSLVADCFPVNTEETARGDFYTITIITKCVFLQWGNSPDVS